jgi:hypothetical protein
MNHIMNINTFQFDFAALNLDSSMIEEVLGYNEDDDRGFVISLIEEILTESKSISNIKAQYTVFDNVLFDSSSKSVTVNKLTFNVKKIVFTQLKKSESIALFLCTAGAEIGIRSRRAMQERDFLRGYIYDVVGSNIVEAAADLMQAELGKSMLGSGKMITNRYSPGYCGWDVGEQHRLFELLPANYCDVRLTESALMDPEKSISGIIGIGRSVKNNPYTCRMCNQRDCVYRSIREREKH